ncbi:MAG: serine hydrolase, partial [Proteobacteria bacterium]|nr:serine hydrolase [Pseudomonadota bacterium]
MDRRELLGLGVALGALGSATRVATGHANPPPTGRYARCFERLDRYVAQYLPEMNIPALTLGLADASGVQRVCDYGIEDLARRRPLEHGRLFHIGSISKSFLALCLMQ